MPCPLDHRTISLVAQPLEARVVEIDGAFGFRLARERVVEIGPVPMRVRDLISWAGRHQELAAVLMVVGKRLTRAMEAKGEAALQASGDIRPRALPCPPLREGTDARHSVSIGQLFEEQIGQGCGRLADGESRMSPAFDHRDAPPASHQRERDERAREP